MPFDSELADRVRNFLRGDYTVEEKRMFRGLAFMVNGHLAFSVGADRLLVRTGPDAYEAALSKPHARPMRFTGRTMRGYVYVDPQGYRSARGLNEWIQMGLRFVSSLSPK
jgi:hypothetical protein